MADPSAPRKGRPDGGGHDRLMTEREARLTSALG